MGRIILCSKKKADKPLYISRNNINIYTIEELSYYLYNNIYIIDNEVINNDTFEWIKNEIELPKLASVLEGMEMNIKKCVMTILKYTGYLSSDDVENAGRLLSAIEGESELKRKEIRAKHLLINKRYSEAMEIYRSILSVNENVDKEVIYNNIGTAYTGLFLFDEAVKYYIKAYEINNNPEIKEEIINALCMMHEDENIEPLLEKIVITLAEYQNKKTDIKNKLSECEGENVEKLTQALELKNNTQVSSYYEEIDNIIRTWRKEYIVYSGS